MQEYLTPEDVAQRYQVTVHSVREWCRSGKLRAIQIGRLWRITPADLDRFIRKNYQEENEDTKKVNGLAA